MSAAAKTYRIHGRGRRLSFLCTVGDCEFEVKVSDFLPIPPTSLDRMAFAANPRTQAAAVMKRHAQEQHRVY
jgi:hypothetical protein